jgi:hypothetical protein
LEKPDVPVCHSRCFDLQPMHNAKICFAESSSIKLDVPESETGGSGISRGWDDLDKTVMVEPKDRRALQLRYLIREP